MTNDYHIDEEVEIRINSLYLLIHVLLVRFYGTHSLLFSPERRYFRKEINITRKQKTMRLVYLA